MPYDEFIFLKQCRHRNQTYAIMKKLYKRNNNDNIFVPEEGQRDLLYSNKASLRCPSFGVNNQPLIEFAKSLKKIHIRLKAEGYIIKEGQIYKPGNN
jgi:hypothetical protein